MLCQNALGTAVGGYKIVVPKGVQVLICAFSTGPLEPVAAPVVKCGMRGVGIFYEVHNVLMIERVIAARHMKRLVQVTNKMDQEAQCLRLAERPAGRLFEGVDARSDLVHNIVRSTEIPLQRVVGSTQRIIHVMPALMLG